MTKVGVLGSGPVGRVLTAGFKQHGYDARIASRTPEKLSAFAESAEIIAGTFREVAAWAEALVLAVAGRAAISAMDEAGLDRLRGKLVMDTTNPIDSAPPEDGVLRYFTSPNTSLMEMLQDHCPEARFVKVFNSVGNTRMVNPSYAGGRPTMFYCGNDAAAKALVARVLDQFGWEAADMGTAKAARAIEPLCQLWCIPGFREQSWTHAFKLLR
jgi:predicted dinucleotide-binding enzyme